MARKIENSVFKREELKFCWVPVWRIKDVNDIVNFEKSKRLKELAKSAMEKVDND
jgi:hypothetical protein